MFAARRRRVLPAIAACALLLSACGGQVGSAAIVDGTTISTESVLDESAQLSGLPTGTLATARLDIDKLAVTNRLLLSREVQHEILTSAGRGATATAENLSQLEQSYPADYLYSTLQATPDTLAERVGDLLAFQAMVQLAVQSGAGIQGPLVDFDVLTFPTLADGQRAYNRYLIDPAVMTAEFATYDGQSGTVAVPNYTTLIPVGLFSAPTGSLIMLPTADGGAQVVKVTGNRTGDQGVTADTLSQLQPADINALGGLLLGQQFAGTGTAAPDVQVNPRFGEWDGGLLQVVATVSQS